VEDKHSCIGCEVDYHGAECSRKCHCENGYCNDDIAGSGNCYCTLVSYGPLCRLCDGIGGSCPPSRGICNAGPEGDGKCKLCFDADLDIDNGSFGLNFSLGAHYGPTCNLSCSCETANGICYTTGDVSAANAGECLYCTRSGWFGADCDEECLCEDDKQYCDGGVSGKGCVDYDYGGLLTSEGWQFYVAIGVGLFVVFFSVTYWQASKQFKEQNGGRGLPWCPQKEEEDGEEDVLKERMIKEKARERERDALNVNVRREEVQRVGVSDEPPMVSQGYVVHSQSQSQSKAVSQRQKYDI